MKTQSAVTLKMVDQLFQVIETRKFAEKAEKELKAQIKKIMGSDACLEAGEFMVVIETRARTDLDKTALVHDLGQSIVDKYSKKSEYEILSVKQTSRQGVANG